MNVRAIIPNRQITTVAFSVITVHVLIGTWLLHSKIPGGPTVSVDPVWASMEVIDSTESGVFLQEVASTSAGPTESERNQTDATTESVPNPKTDLIHSPERPSSETMLTKKELALPPASGWSGPLRVALIPEPEGPAIAFVPAPKTTDNLCSGTQIGIDPSQKEKCQKSEPRLP